MLIFLQRKEGNWAKINKIVHHRVNVLKRNSEGKTAYEIATDVEAKSALKSWIREQTNEEQENDYEASSEEEDSAWTTLKWNT